MNISKLSALCLLTAVFAFAQIPLEEQSHAPVSQVPPVPSEVLKAPDSTTVPLEAAPVSSSSEIAISLPPPASSSSSEAVVEAKPSAPEGKTIFDSVRGHAYNPYGTVGAASTVGDLITLPSDMNGQKFVYISPTDRLGYAVFDLGSVGTGMLGLDNSPLGSPAALVLGYANSGFGIALNYSVLKNWRLISKSNDYSIRTTSPGDNIGLYLSIPLSSATLYANGNWLTYDASQDFENDKDTDYTDYSEARANLGLTGELGSLTYDGYLNINRTGGTIKLTNDDVYVDEYSYLGFSLNINLGGTVLQSSTARVILGANNYFYMMFYDKTNKEKGDNIMGFVTVPNILAEVSLFDNWLAFAGAGQALYLTAGDGDRNSETSIFDISHSNGSGAFAGIRYQRTNWAVEAQISTNVFYNPFIGFDGESFMFTSFGGFIYF